MNIRKLQLQKDL